MPNPLYLGIDTSYYMTSAALVDSDGRLLEDRRRPLVVAPGERGHSPAEAVWGHVKALPEVISPILAQYGRQIGAVAASTRPRPFEGAFLPPFKVSEGYGRTLAAALGVPFYASSHQEMHITAGLWSAEAPPVGERFLAVHLSGGTSELILTTRHRGGFTEELYGATSDLHAGQFVDRVGVALGLPFPAGPHLEKLAAHGTPGKVTLPSHVHGRTISFSGPETAGQRLIGHAEPADIALAVIMCLSKTLEKWLRAAVEETGIKEILIVGGVASNGILRERLKEKLEHRAVGARLAFAQAQYSSDNAVGTAVLARLNHMAYLERQV